MTKRANLGAKTMTEPADWLPEGKMVDVLIPVESHNEVVVTKLKPGAGVTEEDPGVVADGSTEGVTAGETSVVWVGTSTKTTPRASVPLWGSVVVRVTEPPYGDVMVV